MRKTILAAILGVIFSSGLYAQPERANKLEVGVGCAPFIMSYMIADDGPNSSFQISSYLEWRHLLGRHWDFGTRVGYKVGPYTQALYDGRANGLANNIDLHIVTDFIISPDRAIDPYLGIAVGPSLFLWTSNRSGGPFTNLGLGVGPRFGIEIHNHLRLSVDTFICIWGGEAANPFFLNIGWTF